MLETIQQTLADLGDPDIAAHSQGFFKTGPGEYGEGDRFRGIRVPVQRKVARQFRNTALSTVEALLQSSFHEDRLVALFILVDQFEKANASQRAVIYALYLANTHRINNWDLVDASAHKIVGPYLEDRERELLYRFAGSAMLWER
jgi:3-methyladenine DNA glycosylase AlkD